MQLIDTILHSLLGILFIAIIFDYMTGFFKAKYWKTFDSTVGIKGLIKHSFTFVGYAIVYYYSDYFHIENYVKGLIIAVIFNYIISILENLGAMNVYLPEFLKTKVNMEKQKFENQLERYNQK